MDKDQNKKQPIKVKVGYGSGDLSSSIFFTVSTFLLLNFLTDEVGLSAALAGTALMIGKFWDAITDPFVGFLSDRTRTRWGRRRPWLFFSAIPFGLAFLWMFKNPHLDMQNGMFLWATFSFMFLCTMYTFANVPYNALLPDITKNFDERTVFMGYRTVFAVIGTFIGAGAAIPIINTFDNRAVGFVVMGIIFGIIIVISVWTPFFTITEPPLPKKEKKFDILSSNRDAFKNKPFMLILIPWFTNTAGVAVLMTTLIYYFKYIYNSEGLVTPAMVILLLTTIIFIPVTLKLSEKFGKRNTYLLGMSIAALSVLAFSFVAHIYGVISAFIIVFFAGIGFSTHYVLPWSIVADTVEYDYCESGIQREGTYYGLWTFAVKLAGSLAGFIVGGVLALSGYIAEAAQTETALFGIRFLVGPISAFFFIVGNIVHFFYPIDKKRYEEIRVKIGAMERRK